MASCAPVEVAFNTVEPENCDEDKPPIIFLHGITASKEHWGDIPKSVAEKTKQKVYVIDARNHGDSPWTDVFNFDSNVVDLLHFMDSRDIKKATIVGHSMGGLTGIQTALKSPDRVSKLIVEDITVRRANRQILDMIVCILSLSRAAMQQMPATATEEEARKFIKDFIYEGFPPEIKQITSKQSFDDYRVILKRGDDGRYTVKANLDVLLRAVKDSVETLMSEPQGVYEGPAFFIYGTLSPFKVGSDEENTMKFFPNAEMTAIENATHSVHTDCREEFTEVLLKCLSKE